MGRRPAAPTSSRWRHLPGKHKQPDWFCHSQQDWEQIYEPRRIELLVEEMRELIALLERKTGRRVRHGASRAPHGAHQ